MCWHWLLQRRRKRKKNVNGQCGTLASAKASTGWKPEEFSWPRIEHSVAVNYMIQWSFSACIRRFDPELAEVVDLWLWSEWSSVQQGQQGQRLNSYSCRSGLRRPLLSSLDRCWVWLSKRLKFLACLRLVFSLHRHLDAQSPSASSR